MKLIFFQSLIVAFLIFGCQSKSPKSESVRLPAADRYFETSIVGFTGRTDPVKGREVGVAFNDHDIRNCAMSIYEVGLSEYRCTLIFNGVSPDQEFNLASPTAVFELYQSTKGQITTELRPDRIEFRIRAPSLIAARALVAEQVPKNMDKVRVVVYWVQDKK